MACCCVIVYCGATGGVVAAVVGSSPGQYPALSRLMHWFPAGSVAKGAAAGVAGTAVGVRGVLPPTAALMALAAMMMTARAPAQMRMTLRAVWRLRGGGM